MNENALQKDLSLICKDLMLEQPFYGLLLLNLNKKFVTNSKVKTAGVGTNGISYVLLINPEFWTSLSQEHKKGLLQHELMHIAFFHCTEFKHLANHELANIAQDMEINQHIDEQYLPDNGVNIDIYNQEGYNLEPFKGANYYYKELEEQAKQKQKQNPPPCTIPDDDNSDQCTNGENPDSESDSQSDNSDSSEDSKDPSNEFGYDDLLDAIDAKGSLIDSDGNKTEMPEHSWDDFEDLGEAETKLIDRAITAVLSEVAEQTLKMRGTVPGHIAERIEAMNKVEPPKFNWRSFLKRYIGQSTKYNIKKTKRKKSKRFELDFGMKVESFSHVLLAIDSSASVSTNEVKEFLNEIHHMNKSGHDFTLVFADTTMGKPFKYKRNQPVDIEGRGGTDFNEVVNYFNTSKSKYSTLIYLTDGEAPAPEAKIKNVLWVLSSISDKTDHLPGKTIKLN
jgi:predicted metal-dependent peptidase